MRFAGGDYATLTQDPAKLEAFKTTTCIEVAARITQETGNYFSPEWCRVVNVTEGSIVLKVRAARSTRLYLVLLLNASGAVSSMRGCAAPLLGSQLDPLVHTHR